MIKGLGTVLKWGLRSYWDDMALFALLGMISGLLLLPLAVVSVLVFEILQLPIILLGLFLLFLPSPALVGLHGLGRQLAQNEGVSWRLYWDVAREQWLKSLALFFLSLFGTSVLFVAMRFYITSENAFIQVLGVVTLYLIVLWLGMQFYLLPLLLEQERGGLLRVYRNALVVAAAKPILTLGLLVLTMVLGLVGFFTVIGVPMVVLPLLAVLSTHSVRYAVYGPPEPLR